MFKEKYKKDNEMIKPSEEFLEKLKLEMKKEEALKKNHKSNNSKKIWMAAASIAFVFICAVSYNQIFNSNKNNIVKQGEISENSGEEKNEDNLFANSSWYDENLSSGEIYKIFLRRISSKNDLKQVSVSNTNDFTAEKTLNDESVQKLAEELRFAKLIKDNKFSKNNPKYYMACFKNGDIIKFVIYDNRYFECNDFKGKFIISK